MSILEQVKGQLIVLDDTHIIVTMGDYRVAWGVDMIDALRYNWPEFQWIVLPGPLEFHDLRGADPKLKALTARLVREIQAKEGVTA